MGKSISIPTATPPERPSYVRNAEYWEACCERNGTILLPCGLCNYHGEVPWDPVLGESGQWHCPQCDRLRPFLDFQRLWLAPARTIHYRGSMDLLAKGWPELRELVSVARVWRQCNDEPSPYFLDSNPELGERGAFGWGLRRYAAERLLSLNLACAVLYDFYGWLSWADAEIGFEPYSRKRWAEEHADAFLDETIAKLPNGGAWTLNNTALQSALRRVVPASFPPEASPEDMT